MSETDWKAVPGGKGSFDMALQYRVGMLRGCCKLDDIPFAQPLRLNARGQGAVEHRCVEIGFAAQRRERLARSEHVDNLIPAPDPQLVHGHGVGGGLPGKGDIAGCQALRVLNPNGAFGIRGRLARFERQLLILKQECDRSVGGLLKLGWNDLRDDPSRSSAKLELISGKSS